MTLSSIGPFLLKTRARSGARSVAWFLKFHSDCYNVSVAQWIEHLAGVPKDPGPIPSEEYFFHSNFF